MNYKQDTSGSMALSKKDEMSQDNYDVLIARIRIHCQQVIQDAGPPHSGWRWKGADYVGTYVRERHSFITLKKAVHDQELSFGFPPATERELKETERQLGFLLPPLLRLLYTQIANGGFGPGYGITGAIGGYPFSDISLRGDIAQAYYQAVDEANNYRQSIIDAFIEADQEEQRARQLSGNEREERVTVRVGPDGKVTPEWENSLPPLWPQHFLPLCQWGCNISTYIHADTEQIFQGMSGPDLFIAASLEEWLERWLAGEELQFM
jgi:SMI1 / KNR4 family (SUKH-1)